MRQWTHWDTEQNEDGSTDFNFYRHNRHSVTLTSNGDGKWFGVSRLSQTPSGVLDWTEADLSPALTLKLREALL